MTKSNIHGREDRREVNPDWFTGKVWMKDVSAKIGSTDHIYHVHFKGGARTKIHQHNGSQVLIATSGKGSLALFRRLGEGAADFGIEKTKTIRLVPGDVVFIPADALHTHGSTDDGEEFTHIAINNLSGGSYTTDWYESDFKSRVSQKI